MKQALFSGLIFDEQGQPVQSAYVGDTPCYVIVEADFRRHVEAHAIDRQVLGLLREQIVANRELVTQSALAFLGQDDLFSKALIDASLQNLDEAMDQLLEQGLPEGARAWLGLLGFRVVVNLHGQVVQLDSPGLVDEG